MSIALNKIANDLKKAMPFTNGHIRINTGYITDYLVVKFNGHTSRSNFENIKKFLESYNYFDEVDYWYSEALNGKGELTATIRTDRAYW